MAFGNLGGRFGSLPRRSHPGFGIGEKWLAGGGGEELVATSLAITAQPSGEATGENIVIEVSILDQNMDVMAADDSSQIVVTLQTDGSAGDPSNLGGTTTETVTAGVATFTLTLDTEGTNYVLRFTLDAITEDTDQFDVTDSAIDSINIITEPTSEVVDEVFTIEAELLNQFGRRITEDSSTTGGIAITTNPGSATLGGTVSSVAAASGVITFDDLTIDVHDSGYICTVTVGADTDVTSAFSVLDIFTTDFYTNANLLAGFAFRSGHVTVDTGFCSELIDTSATYKWTQGTAGNRVADPGSNKYVEPDATDFYTADSALLAMLNTDRDTMTIAFVGTGCKTDVNGLNCLMWEGSSSGGGNGTYVGNIANRAQNSSPVGYGGSDRRSNVNSYAGLGSADSSGLAIFTCVFTRNAQMKCYRNGTLVATGAAATGNFAQTATNWITSSLFGRDDGTINYGDSNGGGMKAYHVGFFNGDLSGQLAQWAHDMALDVGTLT